MKKYLLFAFRDEVFFCTEEKNPKGVTMLRGYFENKKTTEFLFIKHYKDIEIA